LALHKTNAKMKTKFEAILRIRPDKVKSQNYGPVDFNFASNFLTNLPLESCVPKLFFLLADGFIPLNLLHAFSKPGTNGPLSRGKNRLDRQGT
jgi:hypothetical protein